MSADESDDCDEEEYDKLGSESRSAGTFSAGFGGLLRGVGFPLGVTNLDKLAGLWFRYYANMGFSLEGKLMVSRSQTLPYSILIDYLYMPNGYLWP